MKIPQPSMVIQAYPDPEVFGPPSSEDLHYYVGRYSMWNTYNVDRHTSPLYVLGNVSTVADSAPGGQLHTLVINCHGTIKENSQHQCLMAWGQGGHGIYLGTGILRSDVSLFSIFKKDDGALRVKNIIINACHATDGGGYNFCQEIANYSGAIVKASGGLQYGHFGDYAYPFGEIDDFTGYVIEFHPNKSLS